MGRDAQAVSDLLSQLGLNLGPEAAGSSKEGEVYFCFKAPPLVVEKTMPLVNSLKADGLISRIQSPDTWHISLTSAGPYQDVGEIAAKAGAIADSLRGEPFTFELSQLLPFGGPTAVLAPTITPPAAIKLQRDLALGTRRPAFKPKVGLNPHMTIAWTDTPVPARPLEEIIVWSVTEFCLVFSRPKRGHEVLGRWPLT